jgi:hypothetical protein
MIPNVQEGGLGISRTCPALRFNECWIAGTQVLAHSLRLKLCNTSVAESRSPPQGGNMVIAFIAVAAMSLGLGRWLAATPPQA